MAVVAATTTFGVRRPIVELDGHGTEVASGYGETEEPRPGRVVDEPGSDNDAETGPGVWALALDPVFWPVVAGDQVVEFGGMARVWTITSAKHHPSVFDPAIAYVRAEAALTTL